ncbi:hypothetical protein ACF0H5_022003 [Mactra antiquata]
MSFDTLGSADEECAFNITSIMMELGNYQSEVEIFARIQEECMQDVMYSTDEVRRNLTRQFPEYMRPHMFLTMFVPPVLLCLGTFGNMLSFVIMAKNMLKGSTYSYLAVLAVMDILVLYIGLLRMWIGNFSIDVQHTSNIMCKVVNFLGFVSSHTSVWLIIAVTIERFIAVKCPLRAPRICTVNRARFVVLGIITIICGLNVHIFWTVELQETPNHGFVCEASHVFSRDIWPWVDAAIYSFIPFGIITILNSLIVRKVLYARRKRTLLQHTQITTKYSNFSCSSKQSSQRQRANESNKKLTIMLLSVSFTFLLTTLPMNALQIVSAFVGNVTGKRYAQMMLGRTIVELLMYMNHSINFFLYCATGRKFRKQVRDLLCRCSYCRFTGCFNRINSKMAGSPTASFRLSRLNSCKTARHMMIEKEKRYIVRNDS